MPLAALVIAPGSPLTKSTMAVNFSLTPVQTSPALVTSQLQPSPMPSHTRLSSGHAVSINHFTTASAATLIAAHAASTILRKVSEWLYAYMIPAANAAIAVTTKPMGLAVIARFHNRCAAAAALVPNAMAFAPAEASTAAAFIPSSSGVAVPRALFKVSIAPAPQASSPPISSLVVVSALPTSLILPVIEPVTAVILSDALDRPPESELPSRMAISVPTLALSTAPTRLALMDSPALV
ncbi:Uncharacterised protein [Mycobacteroides abscessus subsp. abscessus]|nr:Uncharacterised protein [Mycobacteroides abscessus subsp. abscessus]